MSVTDSERVVPAGAIATAMMIVEALSGRGDDGPADGYEWAMLTAVDHWGRETIVEALGLLVGVGLSTLRPDADDPVALHSLVPAAVARFQRMQLPEVPDDALPTVAGAVTAAALGQQPYRWRISLGPIGPREHMLWLYLAWSVAELVDDLHANPGTFARLINTVLNSDDGDQDHLDQP